MRQTICVISEDLSHPLDEGIKIFAHSLLGAWSKEHRALGVSLRAVEKNKGSHIIGIKANKLMLSAGLWNISRRFRPDLVCYVPSASATLFSFLRSRMLKLYWPHARVVMVSLQPRHYGSLSGRLIRFFCPDAVFTQDDNTRRRLSGIGCTTQIIPSGVDLDRFTPVPQVKKTELRKKYHLDPDSFTVLHVGHLKKKRNIELLTRVHRQTNAQVICVGSSLPDKDRLALTGSLREQGVVVLDKYIPEIQEIYQLSDCYLFPVFSEDACIGTPLSVLEAMACNLPVIAVRYGGLSHNFKEGQGLVFTDDQEGILSSLAGIKRNNGYRTREKVLPFSWLKIARKILEQSKAG